MIHSQPGALVESSRESEFDISVNFVKLIESRCRSLWDIFLCWNEKCLFWLRFWSSRCPGKVNATSWKDQYPRKDATTENKVPKFLSKLLTFANVYIFACLKHYIISWFVGFSRYFNSYLSDWLNMHPQRMNDMILIPTFCLSSPIRAKLPLLEIINSYI